MIALYHGKGAVSTVIKWFTRSQISHVAWIDDETGKVYEAWSSPFPGKVMEVEEISTNHTAGTVVDLYDVEGITYEQLLLMRDAAKSQIGKPYDWMGVLGFLTRPRKDPLWQLAWFCSEYVTWIFLKGLIRLFNGAEPWKVPPGWFENNPIIVYRCTVITRKI